MQVASGRPGGHVRQPLNHADMSTVLPAGLLVLATYLTASNRLDPASGPRCAGDRQNTKSHGAEGVDGQRGEIAVPVCRACRAAGHDRMPWVPTGWRRFVGRRFVGRRFVGRRFVGSPVCGVAGLWGRRFVGSPDLLAAELMRSERHRHGQVRPACARRCPARRPAPDGRRRPARPVPVSRPRTAR